MVSEVKQLGFEVVHQHYLEVKALYPGLHEPYRKDNQIRIDGTIDIIDRNKSNWATYEIRIVCPENYPLRVPTLFEKLVVRLNGHPNGMLTIKGVVALHHLSSFT